MNRQQRRQAAKHKGAGQNYADVLAKRQIGKETLRMAMEDQAVALAADIICQFGPKRTRQFLEAMESVTDDFEAMRKEHGDEYAEEKLRHRAEQVSGVKIRYQHEAERDAWEKMKDEGESDDARDHEDAARPAEQSDR